MIRNFNLFRFFLTLIRTLLFGNGPSVPGFLPARADTLFRDGLSRNVTIVGDPNMGKTFFLADHLIDYKKKYPDEAMFILDWKGDLTDTIFKIAMSDPMGEWLLEQIVLDEVAHPRLVVPLPMFHPDYDPGVSWGQMVNLQVARVEQDFEKLNWRLVEENPTLGGIPIKFMLPNFLKLIFAISKKSGTYWGITEVRRLLRLPEEKKKDKKKDKEGEKTISPEEEKNELMIALKKFGNLVPRLKEYFFEDYFRVPYREKELRTNALRSILHVIDADDIRAKVGYDRPGWTPAEAIAKGQMVIIDTSRLIGREAEQNFVSRYVFSLILGEIKKRRSINPGKPVKLVFDDASEYFNNQAFSEELAIMPNNYRSKNLHLYIDFQSPNGQLTSGRGETPGLKENFFTIGNIVTFALSDFKDAYTMAEQLFPFDPGTVKVSARTETQHDIMENRDEQKALRAAQIQRLAQRECFIRRYYSANRRDPKVRHIGRTRDVRITVTDGEVETAKEKALARRAIEISQALSVIDRRKLTGKSGNASGGQVRPLKPDSV